MTPMKLNTKVKLHNRFDIEVRDAKTGELKQKAYAENIILTACWARILGAYVAGGYFQYIHVGTGTGSFSAARTSLFTFRAAKAVSVATVGADYVAGWVSHRRSIGFGETEQNGQVMTEVGIASGAEAATLMTHAAIKDANGDPCSITKTNVDIITIYATTFLYWDVAGWEDGHNIFMMRSLYPVGAGDSGIPGILLGSGSPPLYAGLGCGPAKFPIARAQDMSLASQVVIQAAACTKDVNAKTATLTTRIAAGSCNFAGFGIGNIIACLYGNNPWELRFGFSLDDHAGFAGSEIVGEAIATGNGTLQDFQTDWGFVKAGAVIKVDGVAVETGVTVDEGKPNSIDLSYLMKVLNSTGLHIGDWNLRMDYVGTLIFENPYYATWGIDSMRIYTGTIYSSDDGTTWAQAVVQGGADDTPTAIPEAHAHKRYFKWVNQGYYGGLKSFVSNDFTDAKNIHFASPPANGAVITADYITSRIAKDANYVLDITVVIQFGEYTPA